MKIIKLCCLFAGIFFSLGQITLPIQAQTSTKSGSIDVRLEGKDIGEAGTVTPDPESINQAINERINKQLSLEQEKKLTTMIESINLLRRAIFGQVERITDDSLTLTTSDGMNIIPIPDNVQVKQGTKTIKIAEIAVDNWVLVIGANSSDKSSDTTSPVYTPQQITVFTTNPMVEKPTVELGIIDTITNSTITIVSRSSGISSTFNLLKTTRFQDSKGARASAADFEKDISVLIVGFKGEKANTATIIRSMAALDQKPSN